MMTAWVETFGPGWCLMPAGVRNLMQARAWRLEHEQADGENLLVHRRGARESLIKIREHFAPELLKSVENL